MKSGTPADAEKMRRLRYTESYPLGKIPGIPQSHTVLYVSRHTPEIAFAAGIMSVTNQRSAGTSLSDILAKDDKYLNTDGTVNRAEIKKAIRKINKQQIAEAKSGPRSTTNRLSPVRDDQNNITDYRVMMNHQIKDKLLHPDLEFQNVFAHMQSSYVDKVNTIISDKATIDILVHEQVEVLPDNPNEFVNLLDPESPYHDRYARLPREVREYMQQFVVNGEFMVRADIINKVFGFQVWDISNNKYLQKEGMESFKWGARMSHYLLRQTMSYAKDRIVIAMPAVVFGNMASNIFQLTIKKIPISYTTYKIQEGYREYTRYRDDTMKLRELIREKSAKNLSDSSKEGKEIIRLTANVQSNKLYRMSEAGINSLLVEDLNEASSDGYISRMHKLAKTDKFLKYSGKVPSTLGTVANTLFMTKSSAPYRASKQLVQLTDFLARYVQIEYATEVKGQDFKSAMHDALRDFVLFDELTTPLLEALDAIGLTMFSTYFLRNQRAARALIKSSPTGVVAAAAIQHTTGINTLANVNSSPFGGTFGPQLLVQPQSFDIVTDVALLEAYKDIF